MSYCYRMAKWLSVHLRTKGLWVRITLLSLKLQKWRLLWAKSFLTFRQTIEWIHSETCTWYDNNIQSVVDLYKYLSAGIMIFYLKKLYLILRTKIVLCWESKIIIKFSNRLIPEYDPGTLLHLRRSALWEWGGIESIEGNIGRSIQNLCHITYYDE